MHPTNLLPVLIYMGLCLTSLLFYFILFYFILFYFILFYFILFVSELAFQLQGILNLSVWNCSWWWFKLINWVHQLINWISIVLFQFATSVTCPPVLSNICFGHCMKPSLCCWRDDRRTQDNKTLMTSSETGPVITPVLQTRRQRHMVIVSISG